MSTPTRTKAVTKDQWKKRRVHEGITLPSGAVVDIRLPNLPALLKGAKIPNTLVDAAIGLDQMQRKPDADDIKELWEFVEWLVPQILVAPEITPEEVSDLPTQDIELLVAFSNRTADLDAVGHHLGGLETQARFRDFRGLIGTVEDLRDVS